MTDDIDFKVCICKLEEERKSLALTLEQRRKNLIKEILALIKAEGFRTSDIVRDLKSPVGNSIKPKTYFENPKNPKEIWIKGRVPLWVKREMQELGLNPSSPKDARIFKTEYLVKKVRD